MKALFFDEDRDWDGPAFLPIYRWKCWIIGHRPQGVELVNPKTGRVTPEIWCWRCRKVLAIGQEPQRAAVLPSRSADAKELAAVETPLTVKTLAAGKTPLALPCAVDDLSGVVELRGALAALDRLKPDPK